MKLINSAIKTVTGLVVVVVIVIAGLYCWEQFGPLANGTAVNIFERNAAESIRSELGGEDSETYQQAKEYLAYYGIDLEDDEQINELVSDNPELLGNLESLAGQLQSGEISQDEAIGRAQTMLSSSARF